MEFTQAQLIGGLIVAFLLIVAFMGFIFKRLIKLFDKRFSYFERSFALLHIEIESTDAALDDHFKNGYSIAKATKKQQLIKDYEFKNKV